MRWSTNRLARAAGVVYLIMIVTTGFWYGTSRVLMQGDATATLARLQASRTLFEVAIVSGALGFVDFLLLGLMLSQLFRPIGQQAASVMLALVAVSVPMSLAAVARQMDALSLLDATRQLPTFDVDQLRVQVALALHGYNNLFLVVSIFSGLWMVPFGQLVIRSGFLPRVIGVLLIAGSLFYVTSFVGSVFDPHYEATLVARVIGIASGAPAILGELTACLWLLIMGVRAPKTTQETARL
jgi:hypothetical protein